MSIAQRVAEILRDHVTLSVEGSDRMYLIPDPGRGGVLPDLTATAYGVLSDLLSLQAAGRP